MDPGLRRRVTRLPYLVVRAFAVRVYRPDRLGTERPWMPACPFDSYGGAGLGCGWPRGAKKGRKTGQRFSGPLSVRPRLASCLRGFLLLSLSRGPASVIVPLVTTSPALGGLIGALVLREGPTPWQYAGMVLGMVAATLLGVKA